ncbi:MAG: enoyl-CoA hydratase/isomerase family protein, partial [Deltaproteobacteria bacterium]|nr:enoyl-CoA hydratase/isomerase family protein [Deltaproteobacteria bacterium]
DRLVASEDLLDEARKIADSIMQGSPFSHSRHKALVYEGLGSDLGSHMQRNTAALVECMESEDHKEGVAAFLERRAPAFTGR